jgi:signal transduction histidine kinase
VLFRSPALDVGIVDVLLRATARDIVTLSRRATASPLLPDADAALALAGAGCWSIDGARLTTDDAAAQLLGLPSRSWPLARWLDSLARHEAEQVASALENAASPLAAVLRGGSQPLLLRGTAAARGWQGIVMPMPTTAESATGALSARDEFVAGISHELRTPLNAIVGFTRLARIESAALAETRHLDHIDQSAQLMLRVVNDLLDLARLEAGKLEIEPEQPLDLASLAARVLALAAALRQDKPIRLYTVLDPAIPTRLRGDVLRLEQVLVNLAGNAMKFTDRGMVVLGAKLRARRGQLVTLRLSVSDTGVGIPLDRLDQIGRAHV